MNKTNKILLSFFLILMSGLGFSQSVPSYVPTNGLVGWWGFNGNAQDGSGNGNHGTVNGATLTTDRFGNQNGAYSFDGIDDFIQMINAGPSGTGISLSYWFKTSRYVTTGNYASDIFSYGGTSWGTLFEANFNYWSAQTSGPCFGPAMHSWGTLMSRGGVQIPDSLSWHHVLIIIPFGSISLNEAEFYLNGIELTGVCSYANYGAPSLNIGTSRPIRVGKGHVNNAQNFQGKLDDIGIWNRALTPQEITNLYNSQLPAQTSLCLPTITTSSPTSVGVDSVVIGGDISNDGGSSIVLRGICYSTSPNPNMGNQRTEDGSGIGSFNTVLWGLTSSTTYYARSYAKNSSGVVTYGNEVSFTTSASLPGLRCPGAPTVTDIDGNVYNTVQIGNQCWTQSNLKVTKYRNGDNIPTGLSDAQWTTTSSGAYAIYNNDPVNDALYGKLYNWYAVTDSRGLCPTGWHVPSDGEWSTLENHLGGSVVAGALLKSILTQPASGGWNPPNAGATNSTGFTGFPGGHRDTGGGYNYFVFNGYWWSSTDAGSEYAWFRHLYYDFAYMSRYTSGQRYGFSVRCLKNTLPQVNTTSVTNVTTSTALVTGEVISEGDQNTTRGFCYSTTPNPTVSNDTTMNGTGIGVYSGTLQNLTPSTTYYVRAYATNSVGTSYGTGLSLTTDSLPGVRCPGTPSVTDIDANLYYTVQIGNQCWTQSNLKVSKYRNGDNIPTGLSNADWWNTTSGAYAIYNNDPVNDGLYGKLYNHYAVTDSRGLCPTGWHVPTDGEWNILVKYLHPNADTVCGGCWQSSTAGGALKSTAMQPTPGGWNSPNAGATNSSGFTAPPGGLRLDVGDFIFLTYNGYWWSSSVSSASNAWHRLLNCYTSDINRNGYNRAYGFSVRCCRD